MKSKFKLCTLKFRKSHFTFCWHLFLQSSKDLMLFIFIVFSMVLTVESSLHSKSWIMIHEYMMIPTIPPTKLWSRNPTLLDLHNHLYKSTFSSVNIMMVLSSQIISTKKCNWEMQINATLNLKELHFSASMQCSRQSSHVTNPLTVLITLSLLAIWFSLQSKMISIFNK